MSYQALYRTYRPTKFSDVVGQKHIIRTLKNAVQEDHVMHAYVFSGPRGIGKTTIARILAKALNCCNHHFGEPCNNCVNCQSIIDEETTDIVEIDAASNNGVDEMRDILEKVNFLPSRLKKKVYIIDEAHMLSTAAFNALLKTLEEPPAHVIFILATTEPYKIPATILSRCQRFDFKPLSVKEISEQLRKIATIEDITITDEALVAIAEAAEGGMRDALSILDQVSIYNIDSINEEDVDNVTGRVADSKMLELISTLNEEKITDAMGIVDEILDSGKEINKIVSGIIKFCRALLLYKNNALIEERKKIYQEEKFITLANVISESKLFYFIDVMVDIQNKIRYANSPKIFLEIGLLKIVDKANLDTNLLNKINTLEEKIQNINVTGASTPDSNDTLSVDNKIKRLANTIEKYDINGFKEFVNAKLSMLEEVASKFATIPNDLNNRLEQLEENEKLNSFETSHVNENLIDNKVQEALENLKNELISKENKPETQVINQISSDAFEQIMDLISQTNDNIYKIEEKLEQQINLVDTKCDNKTFDNEVIDNLDKKIDEAKTTIDVLKENISHLEEKLDNDLDNIKLEFVSTNTLEETKQNVEVLKEYSDELKTKISELERKFEVVNTNKEEPKKRRSPFEIDRDTIEVVDKPMQTTIDINALPKQENVQVKEEQKDSSTNELEDTSIVKSGNREIKTTETTVVIRTQPAYVNSDVSKEDESAKIYDAKIVERILHQAREQACRGQKVNLLANWNRLDEKVGNLLAPIAKLLMDGKLTANGYDELLIIYPNASICNQLMSPKTHNNAKQILKICFGKDYDFMALPENTWQEKRLEYTGQYSMGNKFPKLSPINNPELKIIINKGDAIVSKKTQVYRNAESLFGGELVEREK